ncbi:MAG: protein phosphatase 2C domain-containing protein [Actinomycetota bacterium]
MDVLGVGRSDVGLVRANNEDSLLVRPELGLYVVSDGMGGHAAGEVASELAVSTIERVVREHHDVVKRVDREPDLADDLVPIVSDAVRLACRDIYNRATTDDSLAGMGCTATAVLIAGSKAVMAHVGDTRLYLVRQGEAHQMSSDHTMAAELFRQGSIGIEEVASHPHRHVLTRALGPQQLVEVETLSFDVAPGDRLVLCSDGVGDYLPSRGWLAERVDGTPVEDLADELIDFANDCGGADNSTVITISVEGTNELRQRSRAPQLALETLGSSFLFGDLSLAQLARVLDHCETHTLEPGAIVCSSGEVVDRLLLIVSGLLVVTAADGRRSEVGAGQHVGEGLVMRPRPVRATVVVKERSDVLILERSNLVDLASRRPWLGVALLSRLVERLSGDVDRLADPGGSSGPPAASDLL